jgi:hypothetical protein
MLNVKRYVALNGRMRDAERRGEDVDHLANELRGMLVVMDPSERAEARRLTEIVNHEPKRLAA